MGKSQVGDHPHPMRGEGESAGKTIVTDVKGIQQKACAQSKSTSALPEKKASKTVKQRVRSALNLTTKVNIHKPAVEIEVAEPEKEVAPPNDYLMNLPLEQIRQHRPKVSVKVASPYLMDCTLEQIRRYRPKEGSYGKNKSVRGVNKGVRDFGELLLDMCEEDILTYHGDYKKLVPFILTTPCADIATPAFLVNSLADVGC